MNREAWLVFAGLVIAAGLGFLGYTAWKRDVALRAAQAEVMAMRNASDGQSARLAEAWKEVESARARAEALAEQVTNTALRSQRLQAEMTAALQSRDVAVSELQGRLTVTILDRILFDSGDASLKPEGMRVLDQVATVLSRYTNRPVQVFGHTDNLPIRVRFPSNWELSTARAVAAVRYLSEKAGVDPTRLSAVGCGEYQPIADNATPEGRARNRRIALVVLPEQFDPRDVDATNAPPAETGAPIPLVERTGDTNAPPAPEAEESGKVPGSEPVKELMTEPMTEPEAEATRETEPAVEPKEQEAGQPARTP